VDDVRLELGELGVEVAGDVDPLARLELFAQLREERLLVGIAAVAEDVHVPASFEQALELVDEERLRELREVVGDQHHAIPPGGGRQLVERARLAVDHAGVAAFEERPQPCVVVEPPSRRDRDEQVLGSCPAGSAERPDRLVVIGRVMAEPVARVVLREVDGTAVVGCQQLVVTSAGNGDEAVRGYVGLQHLGRCLARECPQANLGGVGGLGTLVQISAERGGRRAVALADHRARTELAGAQPSHRP
jgi:hypothetical protein